MSKPNSGRVSFAGLKNERTQNNDLCFNNLKSKVIQNSFSQNLQTQPHARSPYNVPIKARDPQLDCSTASRFSNILWDKDQPSFHIPGGALEDAYQRAQNSIKLRIEQYNAKYAEVAELLADLHIKDLMKLNEKLEKNQQLYQNLIEQDQIGGQEASFLYANPQDSKLIFEIEKSIASLISDKTKSFDCRSTYQSKNKNTISGHSSRLSPQLIKQNLSPLRIVKKSLQNSDSFGGSMRIEQVKTTISKTDSCRLQQVPSKPLEDTPQSVKSKISQTSKIKVQKSPVIGMFDRINICESVDHQELIEPILKNGCEKNRLKRDYRYGTSSQE